MGGNTQTAQLLVTHSFRLTANPVWTISIAALLGYLLLCQLIAAWPFTVDDTFITLRYANHLSHGHGIAWNLGERPVEGFSSPSYLALATLAYLLHLNPLLSLKLFSSICLMLSCWGLYHLSLARVPAKLAILPPILLLLYPGEILWTVSGLETACYQALIIWAVVLLQDPFHQHQSRIAGILMAIAGFTRPEAPALVATFIGIQAWQHYQCLDDDRYLKQAKTFTKAFVALYLPYFIARWYYFGRLWPNPVYCKWGNAPAHPWTLDLGYWVLLIPIAVLSLPYLIKRYRQARHAYLWLPSIIYSILLYGTDWVVGFYNRHFLTAFALFIPLSIAGLYHWIKQIQTQDRDDRYLKYYSLLSIIVLGLLTINHGHSLNKYHQAAMTTWYAEELRREFVSYLDTLPTKPTVLGDCGLIPFLYDHTIIDSYCLNNRAFTNPPLDRNYKKFIRSILYDQKPSRIILLGLIDQDKLIPSPADKILMNHTAFRRDYQLIHEAYLILPMLNTHKHGYRYQLYERAG